APSSVAFATKPWMPGPACPPRPAWRHDARTPRRLTACDTNPVRSAVPSFTISCDDPVMTGPLGHGARMICPSCPVPGVASAHPAPVITHVGTAAMKNNEANPSFVERGGLWVLAQIPILL